METNKTKQEPQENAMQRKTGSRKIILNKVKILFFFFLPRSLNILFVNLGFVFCLSARALVASPMVTKDLAAHLQPRGRRCCGLLWCFIHVMSSVCIPKDRG